MWFCVCLFDFHIQNKSPASENSAMLRCCTFPETSPSTSSIGLQVSICIASNLKSCIVIFLKHVLLPRFTMQQPAGWNRTALPWKTSIERLQPNVQFVRIRNQKSCPLIVCLRRWFPESGVQLRPLLSGFSTCLILLIWATSKIAFNLRWMTPERWIRLLSSA